MIETNKFKIRFHVSDMDKEDNLLYGSSIYNDVLSCLILIRAGSQRDYFEIMLNIELPYISKIHDDIQNGMEATLEYIEFHKHSIYVKPIANKVRLMVTSGNMEHNAYYENCPNRKLKNNETLIDALIDKQTFLNEISDFINRLKKRIPHIEKVLENKKT